MESSPVDIIGYNVTCSTDEVTSIIQVERNDLRGTVPSLTPDTQYRCCVKVYLDGNLYNMVEIINTECMTATTSQQEVVDLPIGTQKSSFGKLHCGLFSNRTSWVANGGYCGGFCGMCVHYYIKEAPTHPPKVCMYNCGYVYQPMVSHA